MTLKTTPEERDRLRAYYTDRNNNPGIADMADDVDTLAARVAELEAENTELLRVGTAAIRALANACPNDWPTRHRQEMKYPSADGGPVTAGAQP